ncbi:MAG: DEAD/DEAH box helicase family protein, partial [Dehalococcoidia bacterium]|nr:DEAD/DEAH box helicase family protein [Dehalococcoidia bacterium]
MTEIHMPTETYVSFDLETTGLDPEKDNIIEIGAVKFRGEETLDTFHTLVNPHTDFSYYVKRLTGINSRELESAPEFSDVIGEFTSFVDDHIMIGQSLKFDLKFLAAQGINPTNNFYDTLDMAKLLLSQVASYSLGSLAVHLKITQDTPHRALPDALLTRDVFLALLKRAEHLDPELISHIVNLTASTGWTLRPLFKKIYQQKMQGSPDWKDTPIESKRKFTAHYPPLRNEKTSEEITPLDIEYLTGILESGGALDKALPAFEHREGQISMMREIARAMNTEKHLIVEAGTGTGKSIAYLLPAAIFASRNQTPVVISTNTINLQEQLIDKDIPILTKALGLSGKIRATALKGRNNYLCLRRWASFQQKQTFSGEEMSFLLRLLIWTQSTTSGDRSELNLNWTEDSIWQQVCAQSDNCLTKRCSYHQRGDCFLYRIRQKAAAAHLVVVNHALLTSDLTTEGKLIPSYNYLIIDEAHHLEERVTEQLGFRINQYSILKHLGLISRRISKKAHSGLLSNISLQIRSNSLSPAERRQIEQKISELEEYVEDSSSHIYDFFDQALLFIEHNTKKQGDYERRLRLTPVMRTQMTEEGLLLPWQKLKAILTDIETTLKQLHFAIQDAPFSDTPDYVNLMTEFSSISQSHTKLLYEMNSIISEPEENSIYWLTYRENSGDNSQSSLPQGNSSFPNLTPTNDNASNNSSTHNSPTSPP